METISMTICHEEYDLARPVTGGATRYALNGPAGQRKKQRVEVNAARDVPKPICTQRVMML